MIVDCIKMSVCNMVRHRLRTILTMIGIIVGICSVIAVYSVGKGGQAQITEAFQSFGLSGVVITAPSSTTIKAEDIDYIQEQVREENSIMPLIYTQIQMGLIHPKTTVTALGVGDNAIALSVAGAQYGRGFSSSEINRAAKVCMVDTEIAQQFFRRENIVGQTLQFSVGGRVESFEVIGVIDKANTAIGALLGDSAVFVYIPYTAYFELSGKSDFEMFLMSVDDSKSVESQVNKVVTILEQHTQTSGYLYEDLNAHKETITSIINIVTIIISAIAGVSLIVGGIGVMTIMLVAVQERRQEIGIKKAMGATNANIMVEFMVEAVILSIVGGAVGILLGYLLSWAAYPILGIASKFNPIIAISALFFCAIIGIIFSVYPAKKAAGLRPIECLKCE